MALLGNLDDGAHGRSAAPGVSSLYAHERNILAMMFRPWLIGERISLAERICLDLSMRNVGERKMAASNAR
jgi:hypothetical protein